MSNTIKCSIHGTTNKTVEEIDRRRGTKRLRCRQCRQARVAYARRRRKQELVEMFGGKCLKCGYKKCIESLDFHHREPELKEFQLSRHMGSWSMKKLIAEASKCDLVCRNCHGEIEADRTDELSVEEAIVDLERVYATDKTLDFVAAVKDGKPYIKATMLTQVAWIPESHLGFKVLLV